MHARVTTLEARSERIDDSTQFVREQIIPRLQQMEGFKGFIALQHGSKLQGIALWESEEALRATEGAASQVREDSAEALGTTITGVEEYEVTVFEVSS